MTHKTKAEKIAASLRTKKVYAPDKQNVGASHQSQRFATFEKIRNEVPVYEPKDLLKTFSTTLFILSLMTLFYVAQMKDYIQ